jgi:putative ABC transport system substrate-binding protein
MVSGNDPVAGGLVTSLARPGGMVTGLAGFGDELSGKYLELLLAVAPKVKRVGFLVPAKGAVSGPLVEAARRSAAHHALDARFAEAGAPEEIEPAMSRLAKEGAQALAMLPFALLTSERQRILKVALARRLPVVGGSGWAEAGALLSYGADTIANHRRAAYYVDKILKGAKPGDLPIEQPTKFELVVNMKTAKALGLTIPQPFLMRADRVIE